MANSTLAIEVDGVQCVITGTAASLVLIQGAIADREKLKIRLERLTKQLEQGTTDNTDINLRA